MNRWMTEFCTVQEQSFDGGLHIFLVTNIEGDELGGIFPADIEDQNRIIEDLENGCCPIADHWEDGNGNVCTLEGWGSAE